MAIPAGVYLDFNAATRAEPDGPIGDLTIDGRLFTPQDPLATSALVTEGALRYAQLGGTYLFDAPDQSLEIVDPVTWAYVAEPAADGYAGRHAATYYATISGGTIDFGGYGSAILPAGPVIIVGTLAGPQARGYLNGALVASSDAAAGYPPGEAPGFLPGGKLYRTLWWDRVLTDAELAEVHTELWQPFVVEKAVSWDAPAATTLPLEGYVVRVLGQSGAVEEIELVPEVRTVTVAEGDAVQIFAKSSAGLSTPVEVVA